MVQEKRSGNGKGKTRIFLVDDHPIVRQGVALLVNQEPDMIVCGDADCAPDAIRGIEATQPDLAVVDLSLKDSSGLELIKDLKIRCPRLLVMVLSMHEESFYAERVLRAGARGYITKEEGTEKVIEGIRKLLKGEVYLSEKMASKMIYKLVDGRSGSQANPSVECLTDRELEIFELIGRGLGTRDIAERLHLSVKTIESHREHIKEKLKLDNATELLKHAIQWRQCERGA
ncbi:MAG: response regulator transcription factor [Phycisphaerae bacterium]|jgi:DNA-binding NarL/FixJ family response regulator